MLLLLGCAADEDGITADHIKWARGSKLASTLCQMLSMCVRYVIVPDSFTKGFLIPLLKKPNIDPTVPKNYHPIILSTTVSKVFEIQVFKECGEHEFQDLQLEFVSSCGNDQTSEAIIINRGTRQGDISSTFLFNLMYQDMVDVI